ncbi:MAG TPA: TetR/AcrR family transcriptional regulator [Myxococcota bacterium]|nr:TetR/AcrR family transcriptional regulator [Myxococcota bacterium]
MAERRERILAATCDIVAELGPEGLSMRDLARRSRVTVPTIYSLIGGRDAVLFTAIEEQVARFVNGIEQAPAENAVDRVLAVYESCLQELLSLPRYWRTFLRVIFTRPSAEAMRARLANAMYVEMSRGVDALRMTHALADWVEPAALVALLHRNQTVVTMQWAAGEFPDAQLRAAMLYGPCCVLAGACVDHYRKEFSERATALQPYVVASFARRSERRRKRE